MIRRKRIVKVPVSQRRTAKSFEGKVAELSHIENEEERDRLAKSMGLVLDRELSDRDGSVFRQPDTNKTYVAYSGTQRFNELPDSVDVLMGRQARNRRFIKAKTLASRAQAKYGAKPTLIGYSLGGSKALWVGNETGNQSIALNPVLNPLLVPKNGEIRSVPGDVTSWNFNAWDHLSWLDLAYDAFRSHQVANF